MQSVAELLRTAARARAGGASWAAVAAVVKRSIHTVRAWPRRYAERWSAALAAAEQEARAEALSESVAVLRRHMRDKEVKISMQAARVLFEPLIRAAPKSGKDETTPTAEILRQLNSDSPEPIDDAIELALAEAPSGSAAGPA